MAVTTECGLLGCRPAWLQRWAKKEVGPVLAQLVLQRPQPGVRGAVRLAGGGPGDGLHLPYLRPHHHRATVRHQVAGGGLDILGE